MDIRYSTSYWMCFLLLSIGSCTSIDQNKNKTTVCSTHHLDGLWGLSQYFDSIQTNKKVAKYRIQELTWHAITLDIKNDSARILGSIYKFGFGFKINQCRDTLGSMNQFENISVDEDWPEYLVYKKGEYLAVRKIPNDFYPDTLEYIYKRIPEIKIDSIHYSRNGYYFDQLIQQHFNDILLSGTYTTLEKDTIIFQKNGDISGWAKFDQFEVNTYFGTHHPFKNMDMIKLNSGIQEKYFHWKFTSDKLILVEFKNEIILNNGKEELADGFILGKNRIILEKFN